MSTAKGCSLRVYGFSKWTLTLSVFCLFSLSSSVFAADRTQNNVKAFARHCAGKPAKTVSATGKKTTKPTGKKAKKPRKPEKVQTRHTATTIALFPLRASWEAVKGSFYPLWFFGKGGLEYFRSDQPKRLDALKEVLWNRWFKDKGSLLIGGALWGLQQATGLTANQYHKMTSGFDQDDEDEESEEKPGVIVVIDNFGEDEFYPHAGEYVYNHLYKPKYGDKVILLKDVDFSDIPAEFKKITEVQGPIKKLDYYGHGLVAQLVGHGGDITDMVGGNVGKPLYDRKSRAEFPLDPDEWRNALFAGKLDPAIFAPNAKIRFNSCFLGNGPDGELFLRGLANSWLRRGGTVYTSNVQILPSAGEMLGLHFNLPIVPQFIRSMTDHLTPIRGAATAYTLLREIPNEIHNPDRVGGPYLLPGSRVNIHKTEGESTLRNEFEKAWASEFEGLESKTTFKLYDSGDIRHYAHPREGTPGAVYVSLLLEKELEGNGIDKPYRMELVFRTLGHAKEYMSYVDVNREVLEEPKFVGSSVFLTTKSNVQDRIDRMEYRTLLALAGKAKARLKEIYIKNRLEAGNDAKQIAEVEKAYNEYLKMLPLYAFPFFKSIDLPRDPELYKALVDLQTP